MNLRQSFSRPVSTPPQSEAIDSMENPARSEFVSKYPSVLPSPRIAKARRTIFVAFRKAAISLFGPQGLDAIAVHMTPEARAACLDPITIVDEFLPEAYVLEWYEAAWTGPCRRSKESYLAFIDRMMDFGFGYVRKFLLKTVAPAGVVAQATKLWSHDHSHGNLTVISVVGARATVELHDHPYLANALSRLSVAEIYRYACELSRCYEVHSSHHMVSDRVLRVQLWWE